MRGNKRAGEPSGVPTNRRNVRTTSYPLAGADLVAVVAAGPPAGHLLRTQALLGSDLPGSSEKSSSHAPDSCHSDR